jgi:hypothetical protein
MTGAGYGSAMVGSIASLEGAAYGGVKGVFVIAAGGSAMVGSDGALYQTRSDGIGVVETLL